MGISRVSRRRLLVGLSATVVLLGAACTPPAPNPNPNPNVFYDCRFPRGSNTVKLTPTHVPANPSGPTQNRIWGALGATDAWNPSRAPRIEREPSHYVGEILIDVEAGYLGPGWIGQTTRPPCVNGNLIGPSLVQLSSSPEYDWTPVSSWQAIAAHEYGHVLGIKDLYDSKYAGKSIMYYQHHLFSVLAPTDADIFLMNGIYD